MIGFIRGTLAHKSDEWIFLDVGGVGYRLFVSKNSLMELPDIGQQTKLFTYLHIREDIMHLFGFCSELEKTMFERLIGVDKIGPRIALAILSAFSVDTVQQAIVAGDVGLLTTIPGIGKKGAQRIILELREKLELDELDFIPTAENSKTSELRGEVREALCILGYSPAEISKALKNIELNSALEIEEYIKLALKELT